MSWLLFFLGRVRQQAEDTNQRLKELLNLQSEWHRRVASARSSALLLKAVDMLFENRICTIPQIAQRFQVRYSSAKNIVQRLRGSGIVIPIAEV